VTLEKTFRHLDLQFSRLQEALEALGTTVEEDRPKRGDVVVVEHLTDAVLALRGMLEESRAALKEAMRVFPQRMDDQAARQSLTSCQERFQALATQFYSDLLSYERIGDLMSVGRERGRDWSNWADVVRHELEQCRLLADEVRDALFLCWQELVERVGTASVSVQNTTIGQQITAPELAGRQAEIEGMT
jgi:hypothetical protein